MSRPRNAIYAFFRKESRCSAILSVAMRPHSTVCAVCGSKRMQPVRGRRAFRCAACNQWLYPTAGTIMDKSRLPLRVWFSAIWCEAVGAHTSVDRFARDLDMHTKTAWSVIRRVRSFSRDHDWRSVNVDDIPVYTDAPHGYTDFLRLTRCIFLTKTARVKHG